MGCSESKSSVATGNTVTQSKKPSTAGAVPIDEPKEVESTEKAVVPQENKPSQGTADVTGDAEVASEVEKKEDAAKEDENEKPERVDENVKEEKGTEKENGAKDFAINEEGSIKEAEPAPATPSPTVTETVGAIMSEESNPPEKKE